MTCINAIKWLSKRAPSTLLLVNLLTLHSGSWLTPQHYLDDMQQRKSLLLIFARSYWMDGVEARLLLLADVFWPCVLIQIYDGRGHSILLDSYRPGGVGLLLDTMRQQISLRIENRDWKKRNAENSQPRHTEKDHFEISALKHNAHPVFSLSH